MTQALKAGRQHRPETPECSPVTSRTGKREAQTHPRMQCPWQELVVPVPSTATGPEVHT